MSLLAELTIRTSVIVIVGLVVSALLRRRSAALRHWVLAGAVFAAALVVPLWLVVPAWDVRLPIETTTKTAIAPADGVPLQAPASDDTTTLRATVEAKPASAPRATTLPIVVGIVWIVGCAAGAALLLTGMARLIRVGARAERVRGGRWAQVAAQVSEALGLRRPVSLLQTDAPDVLATWGLWRPRVLLPSHAREWSDDRIRVVLCHELAHVCRRDWLVQMTAEILRLVFWFNPLLWLLSTRLRRESEQACDDQVLRMGIAAEEYAEHLLDVARRCRRFETTWAAATPMARSSTLERRIAAMLNPRLDRRVLSPHAIVITAVLLWGVTLPTAALRAAQTSPLPLEGAVYDATGAVLPETELTLQGANGQTWQATTDATGHFRFEPIAPGRYMLEASLRGFRSLRQEVTLARAGDWERAITLQVGEVQEQISIRAQRVTGPRPSASSTGAAPLRVGGNIRPPTKLRDVRPIYPQSMIDEGREGKVPIEAIIGRDGSVTSVRVLSAQVHPDFAVAAVEAVRQWRFSPTLLNGEPVEVAVTVSIAFSLSD